MKIVRVMMFVKNFWFVTTLFLMGFASHVSYAADSQAVFAGGCFWCMEKPFEKLSGVKEVISGYSGGKKVNPSYKAVASGSTKHVEAVRVVYDAKRVSFKELLEVYFRQVNPTDDSGQFVDRGHQYRPVIFYQNKNEHQLALTAVKKLEDKKVYKKKINLEITPYTTFYDAEKYHQNYYKKNPIRYNYYRSRSGRDDFLRPIWKNKKNFKIFSSHKSKSKNSSKSTKKRYFKPSKAELRKKLTPIQFKVTQKDGTERPFKNKYWDNKAKGIYVDIVSGEPLFSSIDKFKSGTGWPSFTRPLVKNHITEHRDASLFSVRTEVRSKYGDSHLGHVFNDGPKPTGLRYCVNSASLKFIPVAELKKYGFAEYLSLFK